MDKLRVLVQLDRDSSDGGEPDGFEVACALYWHCAEWHSGQWSYLYRAQCALEYTPGALERGPDPGTLAYEAYIELNAIEESQGS